MQASFCDECESRGVKSATDAVVACSHCRNCAAVLTASSLDGQKPSNCFAFLLQDDLVGKSIYNIIHPGDQQSFKTSLLPVSAVGSYRDQFQNVIIIIIIIIII